MLLQAYRNAGLVLVAMLGVSGCVAPVVVGATGATTAVKASQERGLSGALSDVEIHARVNDLWFRNDLDMFNRMNLTVDQGRVLLTGRAANPDQRVLAVRLVWQVPDVKEVINEITIDNQSTLMDSASDTWIATQLRTVLVIDRKISSVNYSIDVVDGVVYLMGVAHSEAEAQQAISDAKSISRVKRVVSYVKVI
ncbi:MAG: BON domain-containing protein [Rhodospirillaceae bacterium]